MNTEEINLENEAVADLVNEPAESLPENKTTKRKYILVGIGVLLLSCICLSATGVLNINTDFYAGGYSVEEVVVTDELGPDGRPINRVSKTLFEPTARIYNAVYTSGIDATVGMLWYHEDTLVFEAFERTRDNYIASYLTGAFYKPLPSGQYRVEIHIGRDNPPVETNYFTIKDLDLKIVPPNPTPEGHIEIENVPFLQVPFVFDEVWQRDDEEWRINEAKIMFLNGGEIFVVVVEIDSNPLDFSEEELESFTRPIAKYAIDNGYLDQARRIQIDGKIYNLDEPLAITLINPDNPGQGNRARFDIDELLESE